MLVPTGLTKTIKMCYWLCECVTEAMNGCWLMWLGLCCIRLCWWGLWSCWENGTGWSAARLPATLLITGTVWDCDVFKPGDTQVRCQSPHAFRTSENLYWCMLDILCAMAMTPDRGMMRFCVCWWLWWELWMFVSVLTGGRPPPEPEICKEIMEIKLQYSFIAVLFVFSWALHSELSEYWLCKFT